MTNLFLFAFFAISLSCCGQNIPTIKERFAANPDSVVYIKKCVSFIKEVSQKEMSDTSFVLNDKPFAFDTTLGTTFDCMMGLSADTTFYTKEELSIIKDKKYPSIAKWTKDLFGSAKVVSINTFHKDTSNRFASITTFSVPIFLRNDTYCLFYAEVYCGGLCGGGSLQLYKKENNKWTAVKYYCLWVS